MKEKTFDAVKLMRSLRDQLSREMESMSSEERIRYIRAKAASTLLGEELSQEEGKAGQQSNARG